MRRVPAGVPSGQVAVRDPAVPRRLILYVEDDATNRRVAVARLDKTYDLVFAISDREACQALSNIHAVPSLILMDIELKGSRLNGIDLTKLVRGKLVGASLPDYAASVPTLTVPIIFVTAYGHLDRRSELFAAGADEVIQKPVDFVALHTAITRVYLRRLG